MLNQSKTGNQQRRLANGKRKRECKITEQKETKTMGKAGQRIYVKWSSFPEAKGDQWSRDEVTGIRVEGIVTKETTLGWEVEFPVLSEEGWIAKFELDWKWVRKYGGEEQIGENTTLTRELLLTKRAQGNTTTERQTMCKEKFSADEGVEQLKTNSTLTSPKCKIETNIEGMSDQVLGTNEIKPPDPKMMMSRNSGTEESMDSILYQQQHFTEKQILQVGNQGIKINRGDEIFVQWATFPESTHAQWELDDITKLRVRGIYKEPTSTGWKVLFPVLSQPNWQAEFDLTWEWIRTYGQETNLGVHRLLTPSLLQQKRDNCELTSLTEKLEEDSDVEYEFEKSYETVTTAIKEEALINIDRILGAKKLEPPPSCLGIATININGLSCTDDLKAALWLQRRRGCSIIAIQDSQLDPKHHNFVGNEWRKIAGNKAHIAFSSVDSCSRVGGQLILLDERLAVRRRSSWTDKSKLGIILEQTLALDTGKARIISVYWPCSTSANQGLEARLKNFLQQQENKPSIETYMWTQISARIKKPAEIIILVGDFNQRWSRSFRDKISGMGLQNAHNTMSGISTRYSGPRATGQIDFIFANIHTSKCGIEEGDQWGKHSDHRPLWSWYKMPLEVKETPRAPKPKFRPVSRTAKQGEELSNFQAKVQQIQVGHLPTDSRLEQLVKLVVRAHKIPVQRGLMKFWSPWLGGLLHWRKMISLLKSVRSTNKFSAITRETEIKIKAIGKEGSSTWDELNSMAELISVKALQHQLETSTTRQWFGILRKQDEEIVKLLHTRKRKERFLEQRELIARRAKDPYLFYRHFKAARRQLDWSIVRSDKLMLTSDKSIAQAVAQKFQAVFQAKIQYEENLWERIQDFEGFSRHMLSPNIPSTIATIIHQVITATNLDKRQRVQELLTDEYLLPTLQEFEEEIRRANDHSAGGPSGLTYHILKDLPKFAVEEMYNLLIIGWNRKQLPPFLSKKLLYPIEKKPKRYTDLDNIRPIMLLEVLRKLWAKIVIKKIRKVWEHAKILQDNQYGFRTKRNCSQGIMPFVNALEEARFTNKPLFGTSWDIKSAFDSVARPLIELALRRLGTPPHIAEFLAKIDKEDEVLLCIPSTGWGENSPKFHTERGVGQGDSLSPTLWIAFFDMFLTALNTIHGDFHYVTLDGTIHTAMDSAFADDLLSLAGSHATIQRKAEMISAMGLILDIQFAPGKFRSFTTAKSTNTVTVYGDNWTPVEIPYNTEKFIRYLGATIGVDGKSSYEASVIVQLLDSSLSYYSGKRDKAEHHIAYGQMAVDPKALYRTKYCHFTSQELEKIGGPLRAHAKKQLHLPGSFPTAILEGPREMGGLGFRNLNHKTLETKLGILEGAQLVYQPTAIRQAMQGIIARATRAQGTFMTLANLEITTSHGLDHQWLNGIPEYLAAGGLSLRGGSGISINALDRPIEAQGLRILPAEWEVSVVGDLVQKGKCNEWLALPQAINVLQGQVELSDARMYLRVGQKWIAGPETNQVLWIILGWQNTESRIRIEEWLPLTGSWRKGRTRTPCCRYGTDRWISTEQILSLTERAICTKAVQSSKGKQRTVLIQYPAGHPIIRGPSSQPITKRVMQQVTATDGSWSRPLELFDSSNPTAAAAICGVSTANPHIPSMDIRITQYGTGSHTRVFAQEMIAAIYASMTIAGPILSDSKSTVEILNRKRLSGHRLPDLFKHSGLHRVGQMVHIPAHPERVLLPQHWSAQQWANHHADKTASSTSHSAATTFTGSEVSELLMSQVSLWTIWDNEGICFDKVTGRVASATLTEYLTAKQIQPGLFRYSMTCGPATLRQRGAKLKLFLAKFDRDRRYREGTLEQCACGCSNTLESWVLSCGLATISQERQAAIRTLEQVLTSLSQELKSVVWISSGGPTARELWRGRWPQQIAEQLENMTREFSIERKQNTKRILKEFTSEIMRFSLNMYAIANVNSTIKVGLNSKQQGKRKRLNSRKTKENTIKGSKKDLGSSNAEPQRGTETIGRKKKSKNWILLPGQTKLTSFFRAGIG